MTRESRVHDLTAGSLGLAGSGRLYQMVRRQLHQTWISYGLRRDLEEPHPSPEAQIPFSVREFTDSDIPQLLPTDQRAYNRKERLEIANRLQHVAEHIPRCFVAVDERRGVPCFMQWLMDADQNERIRHFFRGRFPLLQKNEALLENAYTPPQYRGLGLMSAAMSRIAESAREFGCRYVITFVLKDNTASLKGCAKAGFYPYLIRRDSHTLFHLFQSRSFEALRGDT
jgi:RimJ/RimL family protein N-acetyltransferase